MTQSTLSWVENLRKHLGLKENTSKTAHNPTLLQWLKDMGKYSKEAKAWWADDETPWCGLAVGHALGEAGRYIIKDWYRAQAWANSEYFTKLGKPAYGAIAVKSRVGGGHVCFVVGKRSDGKILCLGGNQGNAVSIAAYDPSVFTYWWPSYYKDGKCVKSRPTDERYQIDDSILTAGAAVATNTSEA